MLPARELKMPFARILKNPSVSRFCSARKIYITQIRAKSHFKLFVVAATGNKICSVLGGIGHFNWKMSYLISCNVKHFFWRVAYWLPCRGGGGGGKVSRIE